MTFLKRIQWQAFLKIIGQNCKGKPGGLKKMQCLMKALAQFCN